MVYHSVNQIHDLETTVFYCAVTGRGSNNVLNHHMVWVLMVDQSGRDRCPEKEGQITVE